MNSNERSAFSPSSCSRFGSGLHASTIANRFRMLEIWEGQIAVAMACRVNGVATTMAVSPTHAFFCSHRSRCAFGGCRLERHCRRS